jgi:hypothetical protein
MADKKINACLKLGGDPCLGHAIGIQNFLVPENILEELEEIFPGMIPFYNSKLTQTLPNLTCAICGGELPSSPYLDRTLTMTHIHSSLELGSGEVFLLDRSCAEAVVAYFIQKNYKDPLWRM